MRDYITSEIERRRAELGALEERRLILTSQLSVLEDLLARVPGEAEPRRVSAGRSSGRSSDKGRLSARWLPVVAEAVRRYPGTIRGDEVPAIQRAAGQEPAESSNIRSHFWTNTKPGKFYDRVGTSEYRATEAGAKLVGISLSGTKHGSENSNGADHKPAPSSDFENRDEPRSPESARLDLLNVHKAPLPGGGT
jgi:hypothetical protein